MKKLLLSLLLIFTLGVWSGSKAQAITKPDVRKEKLAYVTNVMALIESSRPTIKKFNAAMKRERALQQLAAYKMITPRQYQARTGKAKDWLALITQTQIVTRKFAQLKPSPASVSSANSMFIAFSKSMDQGFHLLKLWLNAGNSNGFARAAGAFSIAMAYLQYGAQSLGDLSQGTPCITTLPLPTMQVLVGSHNYIIQT